MDNYHKELNERNNFQIKDLLKILPPYCTPFINSLADSHSSNTRKKYVYYLNTFFFFLTQTNPLFKDKKPNEIPLSALGELQAVDIEEYLAWLSAYHMPNSSGKLIRYSNAPAGKKAKLSALRTFYDYLLRHGYLDKDPTSIVRMPVVKEKVIVALSAGQETKLLQHIQAGKFLDGPVKEVGTKKNPRQEHTQDGIPLLSEREVKYHSLTMSRDLAIVTLLLKSGLRISECVGLDKTSLHLDEQYVTVTRKGGNEANVIFDKAATIPLKDYIDHGRKNFPCYEEENALFLSLKGTRMTVRQMERMIKKYSLRVLGMDITPHKFRSTLATSMYQATNDVLAVAEQLGHSSTDTTAKHYAKTDLRHQRDAMKQYNEKRKQELINEYRN